MTGIKDAGLPEGAQRALYFASARPSRPGSPRMLLIAYHFPPDPAIGGVRWQEMTRYLTERGWAVDVIARDFRELGRLDAARLEQLPEAVRIFCAADREPLTGRVHKALWPVLRRLTSRARETDQAVTPAAEEPPTPGGTRALVRAYFVWLEFARTNNWARSAATLGFTLGRHARYDVVISSGPPHMAHEGARRIAAAVSAPLAIDLRDPWSIQRCLPESLASPLWYTLAKRYERRAVRDAALVVLNVEGSREGMVAVYRDQAAKFEVIRNGCDDTRLPPTTRDGRFTIRFAGSIYSDRDPRLAFRAAARVIQERALSPSQFAFEFVGYISEPHLMQMAQEEGIAEYVHFGGFLSSREVQEFLAGATMLLSLSMDEESYSIPGKLYEYMRFEAWMLVLAHAGSATELLLRGTEADVVDPADVDAIAAVLRRRCDLFTAGQMPVPVRADGRFDRVVQSQKLLDRLTVIVDSAGATRTS